MQILCPHALIRQHRCAARRHYVAAPLPSKRQAPRARPARAAAG